MHMTRIVGSIIAVSILSAVINFTGNPFLATYLQRLNTFKDIATRIGKGNHDAVINEFALANKALTSGYSWDRNTSKVMKLYLVHALKSKCKGDVCTRLSHVSIPTDNRYYVSNPELIYTSDAITVRRDRKIRSGPSPYSKTARSIKIPLATFDCTSGLAGFVGSFIGSLPSYYLATRTSRELYSVCSLSLCLITTGFIIFYSSPAWLVVLNTLNAHGLVHLYASLGHFELNGKHPRLSRALKVGLPDIATLAPVPYLLIKLFSNQFHRGSGIVTSIVFGFVALGTVCYCAVTLRAIRNPTDVALNDVQTSSPGPIEETEELLKSDIDSYTTMHSEISEQHIPYIAKFHCYKPYCIVNKSSTHTDDTDGEALFERFANLQATQGTSGPITLESHSSTNIVYGDLTDSSQPISNKYVMCHSLFIVCILKKLCHLYVRFLFLYIFPFMVQGIDFPEPMKILVVFLIVGGNALRFLGESIWYTFRAHFLPAGLTIFSLLAVLITTLLVIPISMYQNQAKITVPLALVVTTIFYAWNSMESLNVNYLIDEYLNPAEPHDIRSYVLFASGLLFIPIGMLIIVFQNTFEFVVISIILIIFFILTTATELLMLSGALNKVDLLRLVYEKAPAVKLITQCHDTV